MFIRSCEWTTNFPWQVLFAGVNELTSLLWQFFTVDSNTITQRTRKKQPRGANFVFSSWLTRIWREKKGCWPVVLVVLYLICNMSTRRDMNRRWWVLLWATQRRSQSQGFASNLVQELREEDQFSARTKRRSWGKFSQLFSLTRIRYSKHHNNKTAVRPQFPYFPCRPVQTSKFCNVTIFSLPSALVQKLSC